MAPAAEAASAAKAPWSVEETTVRASAPVEQQQREKVPTNAQEEPTPAPHALDAKRGDASSPSSDSR